MRVQTDRHSLFKTDAEAKAHLKERAPDLFEAIKPWLQTLIRNHEIEIGKIAERRAQLVQVETELRGILPGKTIPGKGKIEHQWSRIKMLQALDQIRPQLYQAIWDMLDE